MQRKAFIHIGLAKTGTTAIQTSATSLQDDLQQNGLRFLQTGRIGDKGGQHCLAWRIRKDARADLHGPQYTLAETQAELAENQDSHVLVSSEEFSPLAYRPAQLRALRALFEGYHVCGIVYVREQVEHFNSFFVELVKDIAMGESVGEYTQRVAAETRYDYRNWIQPFSEVFDEMVVRPYDPNEFVGGEIVQDFYSIVGFKRENAAPNVVRNRSLTSLQVAALQQAVRRLKERGVQPTAQISREFKRQLFTAVQTPEMQASGAYWGMPPKVTLDVRNKYRPLNRAFFQKFTGRAFDFYNHQEPRELNVAAFSDVPDDVKAKIIKIVDSVPTPR